MKTDEVLAKDKFLKTFREFPPRQKADSFTIDQAMERTQAAWAGGSAAMGKTA